MVFVLFFCFLQVVFDRLKGMALVLYNEIEYAQAAVKETKGRKIGGNKIKVCRMYLQTKAKQTKKEEQIVFRPSPLNAGSADCQAQGILGGTCTSHISKA